MGGEWLATQAGSWGVKKLLDKLFGDLVRKGGKFDARRTLISILLVSTSALFVYSAYYIPDILLHFDLGTLGDNWLHDLVTKIRVDPNNDGLELITQKHHYYILLKSTCETCALLILSIFGILYLNHKVKGYEKFSALNSFASAVGLIGGFKPLTEKGKKDADDTIAKAINECRELKMMLINGSSVFGEVGESRIIHDAIKAKKALQIKVLLLDPFSSYAKDRAKAIFSGYLHLRVEMMGART